MARAFVNSSSEAGVIEGHEGAFACEAFVQAGSVPAAARADRPRAH